MVRKLYPILLIFIIFTSINVNLYTQNSNPQTQESPFDFITVDQETVLDNIKTSDQDFVEEIIKISIKKSYDEALNALKTKLGNVKNKSEKFKTVKIQAALTKLLNQIETGEKNINI